VTYADKLIDLTRFGWRGRRRRKKRESERETVGLIATKKGLFRTTKMLSVLSR